jgi:glutathione peroxidase-family protein
MFSKVTVNGEYAHELWKFLRESQGGWFSDAIKWNFTKFLVIDGVPVTRYSSLSSPAHIEADVLKVLGDLKLFEAEL